MRKGYYNTTPIKFHHGDMIYVHRPNPAVKLQESARNGIYQTLLDLSI
jgi:hypothetical protein